MRDLGLENWSLWRSPATSNVDPLGQARTLLALNIDNIRIAAATAAYTVLLLLVPLSEVLVFFLSLVLGGGLLQERDMGKLACGRIGWAMLDGSVSVTEVAEVMDVLGT